MTAMDWLTIVLSSTTAVVGGYIGHRLGRLRDKRA